MIIKQLSVFVENKFGRVNDIVNTLGQNNIDISALSLADASEFGVLRLIVNDHHRAKALLNDIGVIVKISDVIAVPIDDTPGGLGKILNILRDNGLSIDYMYAFAGRNGEGKAMVVMRTNDNDVAEKALM